MAPEPSAALSPGYDAGASGASDFELAGQLYYATLYRDGPISAEAIAALFRSALNSREGCFALAGTALSGVPAAWAPLRAATEASGTLARHPADGAAPERLGFPLVFREEVLGFIGVGAPERPYDHAAVRRFADLASLLAGMLHARLSHDRRVSALGASEAEVRRQTQMLDQIRDSVITMDTDGYITGWNHGAAVLFGYSAQEIVGQHILALYADGDEDEADDPFFNAFLENGSHEMTVRRRKKSGEVFWASVSLSVARDELGNFIGLIGYVVDISGQLAAEETLRLHARIFEHNGEAILVTDAGGKIVSANNAVAALTGFTESELRGRSPDGFFTQGVDALARPEIRDEIEGTGQWRGELQFQRRNGESFPGWATISSVQDAKGRPSHHFIVFSDITERKEAERQIHRLAYYDPLTGLPNRPLFYSLLEHALSEAHRNHSHGAVLFLDLNRFKNINDSFGHTPADNVLREVGRRLSMSLRKEDVVCRLGGDEFVIALLDISRREHAGHVAQKLLAAIAEPFFVDKHEVMLSASIGISIFPDDGRDTETLLKNADVAMYRAKKLGSSAHLFYSHEMNLRSFEQLKLEGGLRRALERGEFLLHYQPQLDLDSNRITGAEALLRWNHPERGMIAPSDFIPVAEETGLIIPIGAWVIDAACRQIRAWIEQGLPPVRVAVNLSARQFSTTLPQTVLSILARHGIPSEALELEITESMLMHNVESVVEMMSQFADAGILMSLDDFGTGYSSLSYLKRFPIDNLKIDQSFVRGIPNDADDSAIARAIISMAKNLRLSVIAEGVETAAQMEFLRGAGCDEIQGYYFSRPLPADEFAALFARTNT